MEPPSSELVETLESLSLATASDLRRCRPLVRRLARGLPTIDSLWIDALLRHGQLSPYQARMLAQHRGQELRIDERVILRAPLHLDPVMTLFEAHEIDSQQQLLVLRISAIDGDVELACQRLARTIQGFQPYRDRLTELPQDLVWNKPDVNVISPWHAGESLSKLLVRRGRVPEPVVRCVARSLARQLSLGESLIPHGDLRLSNVWLTEAGECVLLNWGVLSTLIPDVTIHTRLPQDGYDGLAPERVVSNQPASTASDMYALGCLLWQLLGGRPPFLFAEPLAKLTAHCNKHIPDVRSVAPETSISLAELLRRMTARALQDRPQTFREVCDVLQEQRASNDQIRLKQFVRTFESAAPRRALPESKKSRRVSVAAAVVVTLLLALAAWNREHLGLPQLSALSAAVRRSSSVPLTDHRTTSETQLPETTTSRLQPLPPASADGTVALAGGVRYSAGRIGGGRKLVLKADPQAPATILIGESPLVLEADTVILENVRIVATSTIATAVNEACVMVQAQELHVQRCWFGDQDQAFVPASINWRVRDKVDPSAGRLLVTDTVFLQSATAIIAESPLSTALFDNVLKWGQGSLIQLNNGVRAGLKVPLVVNQSTLRESGPLVTLQVSDSLAKSGRLSIQGAETIVATAEGEALLELWGTQRTSRWESLVELAARGLIVSPKVVLAGRREASSGTLTELETSQMTVDGLLTGEFHFVDDSRFAEQHFSVEIDSLPVHSAAHLPGVRPDRQLPPEGDL